MKTWQCDGDMDCKSGRDEDNCTTTISPDIHPFPLGNCSEMRQMFKCRSSNECIPVFWRCDGAKGNSINRSTLVQLNSRNNSLFF